MTLKQFAADDPEFARHLARTCWAFSEILGRGWWSRHRGRDRRRDRWYCAREFGLAGRLSRWFAGRAITIMAAVVE